MGEHRGPAGRSDLSLLYGRDAAIAQWVADRIPGFQVHRDAAAIGVQRGRDVVAGVVFEGWNGVNLQASIAAEPGSRWASRGVLRGLFAYPFVQLGARCITVMVAATNLPSLNLAVKLGFDVEAIVKHAAHDASHMVILKMHADRCRWISDGQRQRRAAVARPAPDGAGRVAVQPA